MSTIRTVTFNILAPPWADPRSYPQESHDYLDRVYRRKKIVELLQKLSPSVDCFALQETTPTEFQYLTQALPQFIGFQSNHHPSSWSEYITENPPWESNGTALLLSKKTFKEVKFWDLENTKDANRSAYAEAVHIKSNKRVGMVSVHLDSDNSGKRGREMNGLLNFLNDRPNEVVVMGGDFNFATETGNLRGLLERNGFQRIGKDDPTHPYDNTYYMSQNYQVIDHVLVKGALPGEGGVIDNDLWNLYPKGTLSAMNNRITANLRLVGSDHFPVWGTISL